MYKKDDILNVLIFSTMTWAFLRQRPHQIALHLSARGNRIVYFQNPTYLTPSLIVENLREKNIFLKKKIAEGFFVVNLFVPPFSGRLKRVTEKCALLLFKAYIKLLNFKPEAAIFHSTFYAFLTEPLKSANVTILYDCIDDFAAFSDVSDSSEITKAERILALKSSYITAVSKRLCEKLRRINPNCFYVPNGADFIHFNRAVELKGSRTELSWNTHHVIGFIGAIREWVNVDLLCRLANSHSNYSIMIVGPVKQGLEKLRQYPNIELIGPKPYNVLPKYLACMDVCIIPFKVNRLTLASNPIKIYEYLAAGKPVVSTALPEICENASGLVYIARDEEDFVRKVEEAVKEAESPNKELVMRRIKFAKENSWEKRIETIEKLLKNIFKIR